MQTNLSGFTVLLILIVCGDEPKLGKAAKPIWAVGRKALILKAREHRLDHAEGGRERLKPISGENKPKQSQFFGSS